MKKLLTLVALLSLTTFSAIADELQTMTQEQAKFQTQNQVRTQAQEKYATGQSLTPDEHQMQNRMQSMQQNQMQHQMQNRTQSMQQNMSGRMSRGR